MSDARFELVAWDGFEWDEKKSDSNLAKHGIAFDEAREVFDEPVIVTNQTATTRRGGSRSERHKVEW
jgi:uncharacterized DUF497 family protein